MCAGKSQHDLAAVCMTLVHQFTPILDPVNVTILTDDEDGDYRYSLLEEHFCLE